MLLWFNISTFKAHGYTETSHTAVIKKFNTLITENKYPNSISFYANGIINNTEYGNIVKTEGLQSIELDIDNDLTVDNQICQLLKSSRKIKLEEKRT